MDNPIDGGMVAAASAWLMGLTDGKRVLTAAIGLFSFGMALGAGGVVTVLETPGNVAVLQRNADAHTIEFEELKRELGRVQENFDQFQEEDRLRWARMVCLMTEAKDLPGVQAANVCGL